MAQTLTDVMRETVERNGGRMDEDAYLVGVQNLSKVMLGTEPKWTSLKSNAKNAARMEKAGICNVVIGKDRQVWLTHLAAPLLEGGLPTITQTDSEGNEVEVLAPTTSFLGGTWQGVPRRNPDDYPEEVKILIPTKRHGFVEVDDEFKTMAACFMDNEHLLAEGPKGSGKTIAVYDFCYNLNLPVMRVSCSDGLNEETFVGYRTRNKDGALVWVDGVLPFCMKHGVQLILDELNAAHASVLIYTHAALDYGRIIIPENEHEVIEAHPDFTVWACINPADDYAGVHDLNQATEDRFAYHPLFEYLKPEIEARVIQQQAGIENQTVADQLVAMASNLREMKRNRMLTTDTSTRTLIMTLKATRHMSMKKAVDLCFINKYSSDEREDIRGVARAVLADYGGR